MVRIVLSILDFGRKTKVLRKKGRGDKGRTDAAAAVFILQDYLEELGGNDPNTS